MGGPGARILPRPGPLLLGKSHASCRSLWRACLLCLSRPSFVSTFLPPSLLPLPFSLPPWRIARTVDARGVRPTAGPCDPLSASGGDNEHGRTSGEGSPPERRAAGRLRGACARAAHQRHGRRGPAGRPGGC
jgi:hypothetical protein